MLRSDDSVRVEVRLVPRCNVVTSQRCWPEMYVVYRQVTTELWNIVNSSDVIDVGFCSYWLTGSPVNGWDL